MSPNAPVILILGAGPNVGVHMTSAFAAKGYKIALTSRSVPQKKSSDDYLHIQSDLSDPSSVAGIFRKVKEAYGLPSVVVYNAASHVPTPDDNPLGVSLKDLDEMLAVNTRSAFLAIQEAVVAFKDLPSTASRTFIYTGNILNSVAVPPFLGLGMSKSAAAHLIAMASQTYSEKGYKFYYADERTSAGHPMVDGVTGSAHGDFYLQLAEDKGQLPWLATFVKGTGYVKF